MLATARLVLRLITTDDAAFILGLVNDPSWLRYIGDKGVHTLDDAREYILRGPVAMVERTGFGLYLAELADDRTPIGMCGLIKREGIADVDIGFAFLPAYRGQGYALEAAAAVMEHGRNVLRIPRIVAITDPENAASIRLCERIGLRFERTIRLPNGDDELNLFA